MLKVLILFFSLLLLGLESITNGKKEKTKRVEGILKKIFTCERVIDLVITSYYRVESNVR